jgi:LacI family transcriptional regulator
MQAIGILRAIYEKGLSVPGDIALASFDGSVEAEYSWPPLTTIEQPVRDTAEAAVRALVGAERGEPARHRVFPTRLLVRQSCGCGWRPFSGEPSAENRLAGPSAGPR